MNNKFFETSITQKVLTLITHFFQQNRIPSYDPLRDSWFSAIEAVQRVNRGEIHFNVCINHFDQSDVIHTRGGYRLQPETIPTIFEVIPIPIDELEPGASCDECSNWKFEIVQLKKNVLEKDLKIVKGENDLNATKKLLCEKGEQLKELKAMLKSKDGENNKLRQNISKLQEIQKSGINNNVGFELTFFIYVRDFHSNSLYSRRR